MQIETAEDRLNTFFLTADFAVDCVLTGPDSFTQTIPVIWNAVTDSVALYETNIEAASEHFICRLEDLAGVDRRRLKQYQATIEGVTYQLERVEKIHDGNILAVYLKKVMPETIRQKLVNEIKRRLAAITTANGYETELGSGPINEWPVIYQEEELPALGVFDLVNNVVQEYAQQKRLMNQLPFQVRIFLPREPNPATVRQMIADVMHAVITDPDSGERDATLGGLAVDMQPDEEGFVVPKETYQIDGAAVGFVVQFLSAPFNAYQ